MKKSVKKVLDIKKDEAEKLHIKQEEFEECLHHGICPTCGADLLVKEREVVYAKSWLFGKRSYKTSDVICPNGHKLIDTRGRDISYIGCSEFEKCLNPEIRKAFNKDFQYWYDDDDDY
jgi:ssDNA-binding Zn-finger/Zn-ribbon topoisomerase 1